MSLTKLDICNMALGFLGTRTITEVEFGDATASPPVAPKSPEAAQCNLYWDRARRSVLRDAPYNFAIRRLTLTSVPVPSVYTGWGYAYTYPDSPEALKVLSIHQGGATERETFDVEFVDDTTRIILCDVSSAQCVCVVDVEALALWDERFVSSMALKLAILISNALLKNNPEKIKELVALYQASLPAEKWEGGGWAFGGSKYLTICNMALAHVGATMITSPTENVPEAVQCNLHWDNARRAVLRDYPFDFAIRKAALVSATMPEVTRGTWEECYSAPHGCLRVLSVFAPDDTETRKDFTVQYFESEPVEEPIDDSDADADADADSDSEEIGTALVGGSGNDTLRGDGATEDTEGLFGDIPTNDSMVGMLGHNRFYGGYGNDTLSDPSGYNTYHIISKSGATDTIMYPRASDHLHFDSLTSADAFSFSISGNDLIISIEPPGQQIILRNWAIMNEDDRMSLMTYYNTNGDEVSIIFEIGG